MVWQAQRFKLREADELRRAMMGDRGVLMEEVLMAQERTMVAERSSARASQKEGAALKQLETLRLSHKAQRACDRSVEEQNQLLALRVDALASELHTSQQTTEQQRQRILELEGQMASPQGLAAWQLVAEEGKGLHVRLCKAELERDNLLLQMKRVAGVRQEAGEARQAEALDFEQHFKNLLASYAHVAQGLQQERDAMAARVEEQSQRLEESHQSRSALESRVRTQEESCSRLENAFRNLQRLTAASFPEAEEHAANLEALQLAYSFTRAELTQHKNQTSQQAQETKSELLQVAEGLAQAQAEAARCLAALETAEALGRDTVRAMDERERALNETKHCLDEALLQSEEKEETKLTLEFQLATTQEELAAARGSHGREKHVLWEEMGRIEAGVVKVKEESSFLRRTLRSLHDEGYRGTPCLPPDLTPNPATDAAIGTNLKLMWHSLVLCYHDGQKELEGLRVAARENDLQIDDHRSILLGETEALLDETRAELTRALTRLADVEDAARREDKERAVAEGERSIRVLHADAIAGMEKEADQLRELVGKHAAEVDSLREALGERDSGVVRLEAEMRERGKESLLLEAAKVDLLALNPDLIRAHMSIYGNNH